MTVPRLDYYIDAKRLLADASAEKWDIFISAYNDSDRVKTIFSKIKAPKKIWWMLPEYSYSDVEFPKDGAEIRDLKFEQEDDLVRNGLEGLVEASTKICIDITGLMRQHILFIMRFLKSIGCLRFDFIYTEPEHYSRKQDTRFSIGEVSAVRQVAGFEGQHTTDTTNDVLIMGSGYDHLLVGRVILSREKARLVQLHALPSLSADMYHEALLRLDRVGGTADIAEDQTYFSSANDPFVTAATLSEAREALHKRKPITNLYLTSLATKPQAVGFGLFFLKELEGTPASVIFPCITRYDRETGTGLGRTWAYPIDLS